MRALVTGAGGFVGMNLSQQLRRDAVDIICIDKSPRYIPVNMKALFFTADINTISYIEQYIDEIDIVYHLAASADIRRSSRDPWWDFNDNVKGTINLLEFMRKKDIPKIKFMSSSAVYGIQEGTLTEEAAFKPINLYGASKCACESYIYAYADRYGFKTTIFRPAQIVGDYQHRGVIVDFMKKLESDPTKLEILGDGKQLKSYFHVSDCVDAIIDLEDGIFNLAASDSMNVTELAKIVIEELNLNPSITYTGGDRGWPGDTPYYKLSIIKALDAGWRPKYTSEESIRRAVRWLCDKHYNPN